MLFLYASKRSQPARLVATFDTEEQLLAYVRWATLAESGERQGKFEQGSSLAGFERWDYSNQPQNDESPDSVVHNPSPSML